MPENCGEIAVPSPNLPKPQRATRLHRGHTGHQRAHEGDKQKAIAEKLREIANNCEKVRNCRKLRTSPPPPGAWTKVHQPLPSSSGQGCGRAQRGRFRSGWGGGCWRLQRRLGGKFWRVQSPPPPKAAAHSSTSKAVVDDVALGPRESAASAAGAVAVRGAVPGLQGHAALGLVLHELDHLVGDGPCGGRAPGD